MERKLITAVLISVLCVTSVSAGEEVVLPAVKKQTVKYNPVPKKKTEKIIINRQEELSELVKMQQQSEIEDIELLWKATVDNNQLIKFTIQKLNTPEGQRRLHSSLAAKTLSAVVYGATFLPAFSGADALIQSASFASGRLINNFLNRSSIPKTELISDTELIELAGTIESLQDTIISVYYNYKGALNKLKDTRARIVLYNKNYSDALQKSNKAELIISSALYEDMLLEEYYQEQEAKKYYLELERLAGAKTIAKLHLTQFAYKNTIINPEKMTEK